MEGQMKKIGVIDIDGTMTNLNYFTLSKKSSLIDFDIYHCNKKILRFLLYKITLIYSRNIKMREYVKKVLDELKIRDIEINLLTKRPFAFEDTPEGNIIKEIIKMSLDVNKIPYDNIYYTDGDKLQECMDLNADFIIEDSPKNILFLSNYLPVIVIDTPYNKHINGNNIYHANTWLDVITIVDKLYDNKKSPKTLK